MSRSYRKPYSYVVCCGPVGSDRTRAARNVRHKHKSQLRHELKRQQSGYDSCDFLLADPHECSFNDRWSWSCDGKARLQESESEYHRRHIGIYLNSNLNDLEHGLNLNNQYRLDYHLKEAQEYQDWVKKLRRK